MARPGTLLAAFVAFQLAAFAPAAALQAPVAEADARLEQARELVRLINPFGPMVALNVLGWEAGVSATLALDPSMVNLEAQYPGAGKAGIAAARPVARSFCEAFVAKGLEQKAGMFARQLNKAELEELIQFFRSPTGTRVVGSMLRNADVVAMAGAVSRQQAETGNGAISAATVAQTERDALRKTLGQISAEDRIVLMRFEQRPVAPKYAAAVAESERAMLELVNSPDPVWMQKISESLRDGVLAFIDRGKSL